MAEEITHKEHKDKLRLFLLVLCFASMIFGFRTLIFVHAPVVFNDPLEDMSFAWYVPIL